MSHHYSGPNFGFPRGDARLDFTDLFAFPKPGDPSKSILIVDVHPSASAIPPGVTTTEPFAPEALYELKIDTNGDLVADITYQLRVRSSSTGAQTATIRRLDGAEAANTGEGGKVIADTVPVSTGQAVHVITAGDHRIFVGRRSDPFFFDVEGAVNNLQFTGKDFFADKNISSMVLEVPNALLGTKAVSLWARTLIQQDGRWVQADRGARPSQTPFLSGDQNEAYRAGEPADDARFVSHFAHALEHTGGYTPEEAKRVAATLLPDVLRYEPARPASFGTNGRTLRDDVSDAFLAIFTNGKVTSDQAGPHTDLLDDFPYLGPPHNSAR